MGFAVRGFGVTVTPFLFPSITILPSSTYTSIHAFDVQSAMAGVGVTKKVKMSKKISMNEVKRVIGSQIFVIHRYL